MADQDRSPPYAGGCLCGQVRYVATAESLNTRVCHCRICQKAAGSPFFARAMFPKESVAITGRTQRYRSSERLWRHFCPDCGTLMFAEPVDLPGRVSVTLATLDDPDAIRPTVHIWTSSKVDWLVLDDGLPQHAQGFPAPAPAA